MAKNLQIGTLGGNKTLGFSNDLFFPLGTGGDIYNDTSGTNSETTLSFAATLSRLQINVNTSSTTGVVRVQVNGSNGNGIISVPSSTTGIFVDTTNTDSVSIGDEVRMRITSGSGYPFSFYTFGIQTESTDYNTYQAVWTASGQTGSTYYIDLIGYFRNGFAYNSNTTGMPAAGTVSYLSVIISANTQDAAVVLTSNKNNSAGNLTVSIPASTTGTFQDTTHSDTVAAGDYYTIQRAITGSGTIDFRYVGTQITSASGNMIFSQGAAAAVGTTTYQSLSGSGINSSTETDLQHKMPFAGTFSNLYINVGSGVSVGTATFRTRINGSDGNISIALPAPASGQFSDTAHTDTVAQDDLVNYALTGGTSGTIAINSANILFLEDSTPPPTPSPNTLLSYYY